MRYCKTICMFLMMVTLMFSCNDRNDSIDVSWELIENQYRGRNLHKSEITITNNSRHTLKNDNWECYFSWFRSVVEDQESKIIDGETINGDLSRIFPTESFPELKPGQSISFPLIGTHYALHKSDAITGCYFVIKKGKNKEIIVPAGPTQTLPLPAEELTRGSYDHLPVQTAALRFKENEKLRLIKKSDLIPVFPSPQRIDVTGSKYDLGADVEIFYHQSLAREAGYLQEKLNSIFNTNIIRHKFRSNEFMNGSNKYIVLDLIGGDPESYRLRIDPESGIRIDGTDGAGVFYGIQSLFSLFPPNPDHQKITSVSVPGLLIEDGPRFPYRGMHLDVARSFHPKDKVLRFIDLLSMYKMNKLHFHITDDEGWRVEIKTLPELTEIGAFRGHTKDEKDHLSPALGSGPYADPAIGNGSGYYTREDYIEILNYAKRHHVEVIPEIDMPGHIRSAVKAMEVRYDRYMAEDKPDSAKMFLLTDFEDTSRYTSAQRFHDNTANPCMPSTYRFVQAVIDELIDMYKEAGLELKTLHIGGDEVPGGAFIHSPVCQAFINSQDEYKHPSELHKYFVKRVKSMLDVHGINTAGWDEIASKHDGSRRYADPSLAGKNVIAYVWNNVWGWGAEDLGYKLANAGYPVVLLGANNFYFDFIYNKDPEECGLYWGGYTDTRSAWEFTPYDITKCAEITLYGDSIDQDMFKGKTMLTEKGKKNILGLSGTLWSEALRTWDRVEYMAFPKVLGLSERAWSKQPVWAGINDKNVREKLREADWNHFVNKLGQNELRRLDEKGVNYRIPLPGAIVEAGMLKANIRFPGLDLRYTLDGSEPDRNSKKYLSPVKVTPDAKIRIAAFDRQGRKSRTVILP